MQMQFHVPSVLDHFRCLVGQEGAVPLLEAATSLAQDAEPTLDVQSVLLQVDMLLERVRRQIPSQASAVERAMTLNTFFYETLGFGPNANDFADPGNSFMHQVLHTRRGIPISLAVLWMELAHGLGLKVDGISFPGHFLVKLHVDEGIIIQDPLTGQGQTHAALAERLDPFRQAWGLAEDEMAPLHMFLQPASGRDIIERMLRNLQNIYLQDEQEDQALLGVLHRLVILRPDDASTYRDRGMLLAKLGQRDAALHDLQTYVRIAKNPADLPLVEARMELLRAQQ